MAKVSLSGQTAKDTKANIKMIKDTASEFVKTRVVKLIKEIGLKGKCMAKEN